MKQKQSQHLNSIYEAVKTYVPSATFVRSAIVSEDLDAQGLMSRAMQWNFGETIKNPPSTIFIPNQELFESLCLTAASSDISSEKDLEAKALLKWNQEQGCVKPDLYTALTSLEEYGPKATCQPGEPSNAVLDLVWTLHPVITVISGWYLETATETWGSWSPSHPSSNGSTWLTDRRNPFIRKYSCRSAMVAPYVLDPMVLANRFKDGKLRNIYMDTLANYFKEARIFYRVFKAWGEFKSNHHYSDSQLEELIALTAQSCHANMSAYGGDYKAMDQHLNWYEVCVSINVLARHAGLTRADASAMIAKFRPLWDSMTIVVGDSVYTQGHEHMLYSGLFPTHDIESPLNYHILNETCNELKLHVDAEWESAYWQIRILVCGDDSVVLFNWETIHLDCTKDQFIQQFAEKHAEVSARYGQIMELSKVEYSHEYAPFCKRRYMFTHKRGVTRTDRTVNGCPIPLSKYSVIKTLNSLYHPEHMPHFKTGWGYVVWASTILDCCRGMSTYNNIIDVIARSLSVDERSRNSFLNPEGDPFADYPEIMADYWFRNFNPVNTDGCAGLLKSSPSYSRIRSLIEQYTR